MGTRLLQSLVSSGGWPLRRPPHHSFPFYDTTVTGQRIPACLLALSFSAAQHQDHFLTFSFWHKQDVPLAWKHPRRNYTVGLIVYMSSMLDESEMYPEIVFIMILRVCHIITVDTAFVFTFIYLFRLLLWWIFFLSTPDPALTPLAASIQPSLSTAQFQPEPQPAELG